MQRKYLSIIWETVIGGNGCCWRHILTFAVPLTIWYMNGESASLSVTLCGLWLFAWSRLQNNDRNNGDVASWLYLMEFIKIIFTSQKRCCVSIMNMYQLVLFWQTVTVYAKNHTTVQLSGAQPFFRSGHLCSPKQFMDPKGSLLCSQEPPTGLYTEWEEVEPLWWTGCAAGIVWCECVRRPVMDIRKHVMEFRK
jgi:hypothetical protein